MKCSVLLCGLLLMQAVGLSAKEQVRLSADDVKMVRSEDSVRVSFRLNVGGLGRDYVLKVTPLLRGKGGQEACLPKLNYGSRRAQIVEWREGGMKRRRRLLLPTTRRAKNCSTPIRSPTTTGWKAPPSIWKRRARAVAAKRHCSPCGCWTMRCLPPLPNCLFP